MKEKILVGVIAVMLLTTVGLVMAGNGKDKDPGVWINYGNIRVDWEWADSNPWGGTDNGSGYYYKWCQDRDLDGTYSEGWVTVDYGKYGGSVSKDEGTSCANDFGFESEPMVFSSKVIPLTESWVSGVSVPGGVSRFVVKDTDGDGEYTGESSNVLFWPGLTISNGGYMLIQNKFEYHYVIDGTGKVTDGYYIQYQYFMIPGTGGAPSGGQ